ncbi:MAG: UDPGP type 1 family protein [Spirochaetes bacterium]|nr:UDPGP type 1 family protein [Spirochaetota bacterium]
MITFPGYESIIRNVYDKNQEHVFLHWDGMNDEERRRLLEDLAGVDFDLIERLFTSGESHAGPDFEPAPFISLPGTEDEKAEYVRAREAGEAHVRDGKMAAFVVAGGQGSRLGYEGPKGKFPVGPISGKSLFHIHAEKVLASSRKYGTRIPFLIMTSRANHGETVEYFKEHHNFGIDSGDLFIFPQNMIPALDTKGRLILEDKDRIFKNPDGHGGSLTALSTSGVLEKMKERGIETISYFQVDNPLVRIIDPVFIGFHLLRDADVSSKAVRKAYPEEKVGVFVRYPDGTIGVVEYSDLPREKTTSRDAKGELHYIAGSIAIHLFRREFIERLTEGREISLPYHTAKKKIPAYLGGEQKEIDGLKYEKFVFDALPLTEKNVVFETLRESEFAPVKNREGVDSVESARAMMSDEHRRWLDERGIRIPASVRRVEISPLAALEPDDLEPSLTLPDDGEVYLS